MGTICGLSARETLFFTPGELYDIFDIYLEANGNNKKSADDF